MQGITSKPDFFQIGNSRLNFVSNKSIFNVREIWWEKS